MRSSAGQVVSAVLDVRDIGDVGHLVETLGNVLARRAHHGGENEQARE